MGGGFVLTQANSSVASESNRTLQLTITMNAVSFGTQLVATGDLDPIYLMLRSVKDQDVLMKWCLVYWMFYHAGVASKIAEAPTGHFWDLVRQADTEKWPRGTERRHFRAKNSANAIDYLRKEYPWPLDAVAYAATGAKLGALDPMQTLNTQPFLSVRNRVLEWVGFGPWIAFKVADMVDAVVGVDVDFDGAEAYLFDDPRVGAILVEAEGDGQDISVDDAKWIVNQNSREEITRRILRAAGYLQGQPGLYKKSPAHAPQRHLRLQEFETIFCKYKSHLNGHYPMGKDTREIIHGLVGWGDLATDLRAALIAGTPEAHHA